MDDDVEDGIAESGDAIELPIDGTLDLHTFQPSEVRDLVSDYVEACHSRGIVHLRIVHGKGKGILREIVRSALEKHPLVESFWHEGSSGGSWGATVIDLKQ
jgi:DNA-nicking Smr family endonuclease